MYSKLLLRGKAGSGNLINSNLFLSWFKWLSIFPDLGQVLDHMPEFPIKNYDPTRETNSNFHQRNFISYHQIQGTAHLSNTEGIYKTSRISAQQVVAGTNKKKQKLFWDFFLHFWGEHW